MSGGITDVSCIVHVCVYRIRMQLNEMATELEDQRELATSRLTELEKLQQDHQDAVKQIETLKMDVRGLSTDNLLLLLHCVFQPQPVCRLFFT